MNQHARALFGGTLLAAGLATEPASAQQIQNFSNTASASAHAYIYIASESDFNSSPTSIDVYVELQGNIAACQFNQDGLSVGVTMAYLFPYAPGFGIGNADVTFSNVGFEVDQTLDLELYWDFRDATTSTSTTFVRLVEATGPTLVSIRTNDGVSPLEGARSVRLVPGARYEMSARVRVQDRLGTSELRASISAVCLADWDQSGGQPNSSDFLSYLNDWTTQEPDADLAPAGGDGAWDSSDFLAYLNLFAQGC